MRVCAFRFVPTWLYFWIVSFSVCAKHNNNTGCIFSKRRQNNSQSYIAHRYTTHIYIYYKEEKKAGVWMRKTTSKYERTKKKEVYTKSEHQWLKTYEYTNVNGVFFFYQNSCQKTLSCVVFVVNANKLIFCCNRTLQNSWTKRTNSINCRGWDFGMVAEPAKKNVWTKYSVVAIVTKNYVSIFLVCLKCHFVHECVVLQSLLYML